MSPTKTQTIPEDLEPRFSAIKQKLVKPENVEAVTASWKRLLKDIEQEFAVIEKEGSAYVPQVQWQEIVDNDYKLPTEVQQKFKQRGSIMVHGVVDENQINKWFDDLVQFCKDHPETAGYTFPNPTLWYNVFWTKLQTEARSHPNVKKLINIMSNQFTAKNPDSLIDLNSQVVYGDRIRIRPPGTRARLPLHLDLSSIERWEDPVYRSVYQEIFEGNWEQWDPYAIDKRAYAIENMYNDLESARDTICSAFRTLQGWLGLSDNRLGEGTLRVLPNVKLTMAYIMLRPLFWRDPVSGNIDDYEIDLETPKFPGARPSTGQLYLADELYPHLRQRQLCVSVPDVKKGTFVFWHSDLPHEVDKEHHGNTDSSVFYYGVAPLSPVNIDTLLDTKNAFTHNILPEDYRSQLTEEDKAKEYQGASVEHIGDDVDFKRLMGLAEFDTSEPGLTAGQVGIRELANQALAANAFDHHQYLKANPL